MKNQYIFPVIKLIACIALLGMGTVVYADILAGGAIYGGTTQVGGTCYVFNAGNAAVTILDKQIIEEFLGPLTISADNCPSNIVNANSICAFSASFINGVAHSCMVVISPSGADVRGQFEVRDSSLNILNNVELR